MRQIKVIEYSESNSLISAILFLVFGVILFTNPGGIVEFISYITGGLLILIGIVNILSYRKTLKNLNIRKTGGLICGVLLITFGIVAIVCAGLIENIVRLIICSWVLYSGIIRMISAFNFRQNKISFIARLSISIILIICGLYVLLKSNLVFSIIGLFIIIYSVLEIAGYVFYSKK